MKYPHWNPSAGAWVAVTDGHTCNLPTRKDLKPGFSSSAKLAGIEVALNIIARKPADSFLAEVLGFEGIFGDTFGGLTIGDSVLVSGSQLCSAQAR